MLALLYTLLRSSSCSDSECHISSIEPERLCLEDTSVENNTSNNSLLDNSLLSDTMYPNTKSVTEPIRNEVMPKCINHIRLMLSEPDFQSKTIASHVLKLNHLLIENGESLKDSYLNLINDLIYCEFMKDRNETDDMFYGKLYNNCKALLKEVLGTMLKERDYESGDTNELTLKTTGRD